MKVIEPDYPRPMFRRDEGPIYVHNAKEEEAKAAEGWTHSYIPRAYPRMLYSCTDRQTLIVQSHVEEERALADGWQREPETRHYGEHSSNPELPLPGPEPGSPATLPAAQYAQFLAMQAELAEQRKLITSMLLERERAIQEQQAPKPAPPRRPPPFQKKAPPKPED